MNVFLMFLVVTFTTILAYSIIKRLRSNVAIIVGEPKSEEKKRKSNLHGYLEKHEELAKSVG